MPLPGNFSTVPVHGKYLDLAGAALAGTVTFTATPDALTDPAALIIIMSKPLVMTLDVNGEFTTNLPATDDPDIDPIGFTYKVVEAFPGRDVAGREYYITVPVASLPGGIDLTTAAPAIPVDGVARGQFLNDLGDVDTTGAVTDSPLVRDSTGEWVAGPALSATFASSLWARPGSRYVSLGDSITTPGAIATGDNYPSYASLVSLGQLLLVNNAGLAGDTTTQMLARWNTDVVPYSPNIVSLNGGANDIAASVTLATFQANVQTFVANCKTLGALPVLSTIPPHNTLSRYRTIQIWNAWLRRYAAANRIPLVDFFGLLADPATAQYLSAYYNDGTHPNAVAYAAMGSLLFTTLQPLLPPANVLLAQDQYDHSVANTTNPVNATRNPLMLDGVNGGGNGYYWSPYGTATYSQDATDTTIKGKWQRMVSAGAGSNGLYSAQLLDPAVGHTCAISGLIKSSGGGKVRIAFAGASGGPFYAVYELTQPITKGLFYTEFVVPTGFNPSSYLLMMDGAGTLDVAQMGLFDLTALGVL